MAGCFDRTKWQSYLVAISIIASFSGRAAVAADPRTVAWAHNLYQCGETTSSGTRQTLKADEALQGIDLTKATTFSYGDSHSMKIAYDKTSGIVALSDDYNVDSAGVNLSIARSPTPPDTVASGSFARVTTRSGFKIGSRMSDVLTKLGATEKTSGSCSAVSYAYTNPGCDDHTRFISVNSIVVRIDYSGSQC